MTREEFNQIFVELGWTRFRDDGDTVVTRRVKNGIIWDVLKLSSNKTLRVGPCLSIDVFDFADHLISESNNRILETSIICQTQWSEHKDGFTREDAERHSDKMLEWAASADIEAGLAALRALPTDCLGAMPVRHLAALAVAGDVETLERYRDSFAAGDRLDFVPYIDEGYIARALDFAQKRRADPNWMPDKPKLRV